MKLKGLINALSPRRSHTLCDGASAAPNSSLEAEFPPRVPRHCLVYSGGIKLLCGNAAHPERKARTFAPFRNIAYTNDCFIAATPHAIHLHFALNNIVNVRRQSAAQCISVTMRLSRNPIF